MENGIVTGITAILEDDLELDMNTINESVEDCIKEELQSMIQTDPKIQELLRGFLKNHIKLV